MNYKIFLFLLFLFLIPRFVMQLNADHLPTSYQEGPAKIQGVLDKMTIDGDRFTFVLKAKEKIKVSYTIKTEEEKKNIGEQFHLGDVVTVLGEVKKPSGNRVFHLFHYRHYLLSEKISWIMESETIQLVKKTGNPFYQLKNGVIRQIEKGGQGKPYLYAFLLGDTSYLENSKKTLFQEIGVSHLFAVSGMHITLLSSFLFKALSTFWKNKKVIYGIILTFLLVYLFLTNFAPSVLRATFLFFILTVRKLTKCPFTTLDAFFTVLLLLLFYNPFYVYHPGFLFSFTVSFYLILFSDPQKQSYVKGLIKTSTIAFLAGLPLVITLFFELSFFTIIFNLLFVPFVSLILFPSCFLIFFFPFFSPLFAFLIFLLESCAKLCEQVNFLRFTFAYTGWFLPIFYSILIVFALKRHQQKKYGTFLFLGLLLFLHSQVLVFNSTPKMFIIDVGQGDSILFVLPHGKTVLVDTGGRLLFEKKPFQQSRNEYSLTKQTLLPFFKSLGMKRIDYLILTHGDADHSGEAEALVTSFPVGRVILNSGNDSFLEKKLLQHLTSKKIPYQKIAQGKLEVGNIPFWFLNQKNEENENDDSLIIYTEMDKWNILLMGDASIKNEKILLEEYNLPKVDILKIGHHGSVTSTSDEFLDQIKPANAFISVALKNRYQHPHEETLKKLQTRDIATYLTSTNGSIELRFKKKITIRTCPP